MLLSRIPVLDKGYVTLLDSCNTTQKLRDIGKEFFGGEYPASLEEFGSMTLAIKCPIFVQLALSKFNLRIANAESKEVEAYIPNAGEIRASDIPTSQVISDDISRTTDALILNPKSYQADGCDRFVSQVITPINIYTILIVQGSYSEWCKFAYQQKLPAPIRNYAAEISNILEAEWK